MGNLFKKHEIERALHDEHKAISAGTLKEDNPLDTSQNFRVLCEACRRGDLKACQERINEGANVNARDPFDYTPLILASLCGHFEVVQLLLESGALCERDTFQGERCLYNALNDRIRNLLLSYDYSKSTDPLQPLAAHISTLLTRTTPRLSDITVVTATQSFGLHKFLLATRSPYFANKLGVAPDTSVWTLPKHIPSQSFEIAMRYIYLSDPSTDIGDGEDAEAIVSGVLKLSRQLEMANLVDSFLEIGDRRVSRQKRTDEISRGQYQLESWFTEKVLRNKMRVASEEVDGIRWDRENSIFADVIICTTDDEADEDTNTSFDDTLDNTSTATLPSAIPIGPNSQTGHQKSSKRDSSKRSMIFPAHRAMLIRSEFFLTMFSSSFREAQDSEYLQIIHVDCSPEVFEIVLRFLYTEHADVPLDLAIEVLFAADLLLIDKLKVKAATIISTLGSGSASIVDATKSRGAIDEDELIDIYDVLRAGWMTRVQRLEEFGARYIAYRLERFVDDDEFAELVRESAGRIQQRQETDSIELIDDIRHYLSERFRLRFEDAGLDEMMEEATNGAANMDLNGTEKEESAAAFELTSQGQHEYDQEIHATTGAIRTLDGDVAGDEFAQDAINYQILMGKIDSLLDRLQLDA